MPNRNYLLGRALEYRVRDQWRAEGFTALRSAGSHSPYDVLAVKPTGPAVEHVEVKRGIEYRTYTYPITGYAVQCKRKTLKATKAPRQRANH